MLHEAVASCNLHMVKLLLTAKPDINGQNKALLHLPPYLIFAQVFMNSTVHEEVPNDEIFQHTISNN